MRRRWRKGLFLALPAEREAARAAADGGFTPVTYSAADGLRLYARDYGRANRLARPELMPVVCLPGLTRNSRDFHRLALKLSGDSEQPRRVVAFDYRGRGLSERDRSHAGYSLPVESEDVLAGMAALGLSQAAFIGTSRGVLIILMLAAMRPDAVQAAVFNDAGPVIDGVGLMRIRTRLERRTAPKDWPEAARILKEGDGSAFPLLSDDDWREMATAVFREVKGRPVADYDPRLVGQLKGLDITMPLPTLWPQFDGLAHCPIMTIRGEYSDLLSERTVAEMKRRHPGMTAILATGQGHAPVLHLDRLDAKIAAFLRANDPI